MNLNDEEEDLFHKIFDESGVLAQADPDYERREGQVKLAKEIYGAIANKYHLFAEGATGCGKSYAYLVPALHWARKKNLRVVIATANNALQSQLLTKDIPHLKEAIDWAAPVQVRPLKGRANFVCQSRVTDVHTVENPTGMYGYETKLSKALDGLVAWSGGTSDGDRESATCPPPAKFVQMAWHLVSVSANDCKGTSCTFAKSCYANLHKQDAWRSPIIVTNYHILFSHIAKLKALGRSDLLPPFDVLIMDEAHEAVKAARECFGFTVKESSFGRLVGTLEAYGGEGYEIAQGILQARDWLFGDIAVWKRGYPEVSVLKHKNFVKHAALVGELQRAQEYARKQIGDQPDWCDDAEKERLDRLNAEYDWIDNRCGELADQIDEFVTQSVEGKVYWIDRFGKDQVSLEARTIDVSGILREQIFNEVDSVIVTSATLTAAGGDFSFICKQMGSASPQYTNTLNTPNTKVRTISIPSPFDLKNRMMFAVADNTIPPPKWETRDQHLQATIPIYKTVIDACQGRTLCLFTSKKDMDDVYEALRGYNDFNILKQGDGASRADLQHQLLHGDRTVLLGVASFWQGVDIPGDALVAVTIHKLPYPNPKDPIVAAIADELGGGTRYFSEYSTPTAVVTFRQGIGRLIRSKTDYGVVVILDNRFNWKNSEPFRSVLPSGCKVVTTSQLKTITQKTAAGRVMFHQPGAIEAFFHSLKVK